MTETFVLLTLFGLSGCRRVDEASRVPAATFDAGAVFYETTPQVRKTFELRNTTGRTVRVKEIRRTCTCTCTEATCDREVIEPGELAHLTMVVKSAPILHDWDVAGSLVVDDPVNPYWTCHLRFQTYRQGWCPGLVEVVSQVLPSEQVAEAD